MRSALLWLCWLALSPGVLVARASEPGLSGASTPAPVFAAGGDQPAAVSVVVVSIDGALEPASVERLKLGLARELHDVPGPGGSAQLGLTSAPSVATDAGWRSELLLVLANPSLALVLLTVGIYGLIFEFAHPGFLLPGVAGAISLLLGLFALQTLPIDYAGLALIVLGLGFMVAEAFVPSFGALGLGGIVAFAIGALLLVDRDAPDFVGIPYSLVALLTLLSAAFVLGVVGMAVKARRRPLVSGAPALLGQTAEMVEFDAGQGEGWALLAGVHWRVRAVAGLADPAAAQLVSGTRVVVRAVRGNTLEVASLPDPMAAAQPARPAATH